MKTNSKFEFLKLLFCTPEKAYFGEILLNFIDTNQFLFSFILLSYLRVPSVCKYTFKVKNEQFKKNSQIFLCNFVQYRYFFSFQVELAQKLHLNMYIVQYSKIINKKHLILYGVHFFNGCFPNTYIIIHIYILCTVYPISIDLCQIFFSKWEKEYIYIPFMPINRDKYREI